MTSVTVGIFVSVVLRNSYSPMRTAFKVFMFDINASVNYVGINTFTAVPSILVLCESREREFVTVTDTSKTLEMSYLVEEYIPVVRMTHPWRTLLSLVVGVRESFVRNTNYLITLDEVDLRLGPNHVDGTVVEATSITE